MEYVLLIYGDERRWAARTEEESERVRAAHDLFASGLRWDGQMLLGEPLETTSAARTLRGDVVTDGPFAETKEQLGGLYVIEADSIEEAVAIARRIPGAGEIAVEVRPAARVRTAQT
jgi:hypothetical protein